VKREPNEKHAGMAWSHQEDEVESYTGMPNIDLFVSKRVGFRAGGWAPPTSLIEKPALERYVREWFEPANADAAKTQGGG